MSIKYQYLHCSSTIIKNDREVKLLTYNDRRMSYQLLLR